MEIFMEGSNTTTTTSASATTIITTKTNTSARTIWTTFKYVNLMQIFEALTFERAS